MDNYNLHYNDCYFSNEGGLDESVWVFIKGNNISRFLSSSDIYVGECGFGSGLNLLSLSRYLNSEIDTYSGTVNYFSCEKYPLLPEQVYNLLFPLFIADKEFLDSYINIYRRLHENLKPGNNCINIKISGINIILNLYYGDVLDALSCFTDKIDVWFLDGHDPEKNPDMWSDEVFRNIAEKSHPGTTLSTYTAKGSVKTGLRDAGFFIKRKKGYGRKRHMITGRFDLR